jgi:DNA-binding NtrC family response regulator
MLQGNDKRSLLYFCEHSDYPALPPAILNLLSSGWSVEFAADPAKAINIISRDGIHVGLAQFDHVDASTMSLAVENLFRRTNQVEWIGLVARDCLANFSVKQMIWESLYDYHTLPLDADRLLATVGHAYGMARMKWGNEHISDVKPPSEDEMVGASPQIQELFRDIRKVAGVDAPVLITGESGTGKELAALAVHERSARSNGPFIVVNCGALPANLIQSELFGYEKGAFTGAQRRKIGHIEAASGGTIFLDEIGDLPFEMQVNLLRFLQEKTIARVGGNEQIHVDTRVIAATHVDMEKAAKEGRFREDLLYRLNVLHLKTPALRNRQGDIELLAKYFFDGFSHEKRPNVKGFSPSAMNTMKNYTWPGNVRELINRVRRAMVMCESRLISPVDLGLERLVPRHSVLTLDEMKARVEEEGVRNAIVDSSGNLSVAARNLGVSRVTLYRLIERYGIRM